MFGDARGHQVVSTVDGCQPTVEPAAAPNRYWREGPLAFHEGSLSSYVTV